MDRWEGRVVLVTGASRGIGAEIAKQLAKNGMKVIAAARTLNKLQELAAGVKRELNVDIYPMRCDVKEEKDILKIFKWADEKLDGIDVLINNVAVLHNETIIEGSTANYNDIMKVNVIGTAICSRELMKSVQRRKTFGHIININSIAGHYAELINLPFSLYSASKYAIVGLAANLRNELMNMGLNIKVTNISPGSVKTDMLASVMQNDNEDIPCLLTDDVATTVVFVLSMPQHVQISQVIMEPHTTSGNSRWYARNV